MVQRIGESILPTNVLDALDRQQVDLEHDVTRWLDQAILNGYDRYTSPDMLRRNQVESLHIVELYVLEPLNIPRNEVMIRGSSALLFHQLREIRENRIPIRGWSNGTLYTDERDLWAPSDVDLLIRDGDKRLEQIYSQFSQYPSLFHKPTLFSSNRELKSAGTSKYRFDNASAGVRLSASGAQPTVEILTQMNTLIPGGVLRPAPLRHRLPTQDLALFSLCSEHSLPHTSLPVATLPFLAFWETVMPKHSPTYMQELRQLGLSADNRSTQAQITFLAQGFETDEQDKVLLADQILERIG